VYVAIISSTQSLLNEKVIKLANTSKKDSATHKMQRKLAEVKQLKRNIGFWTLAALVVGSVIGSGMFAVPAVMGSVAGPALVAPLDAKTISISNLRYPSTIRIDKQLTVSFTISYSGANLSEYGVAAIITSPQQRNVTFAEGSLLSSSPDICQQVTLTTYSEAGCYFKLTDTQGSENVTFSLADTSPGAFSFTARALLMSYSSSCSYMYNMCVDAEAGDQFFSISVINKITLTVNVPEQVSITLDGVPEITSGSIAPQLSPGTHEISIADTVQIDPTSRLKFVGWSDRSRQLTRTFDLESDTEITANYVTQYYVSAGSDSTLEPGWYDSGTLVQLSVDQTQLWNSYRLFVGGFDGWYSSGGQLISKSQSASIEIQGPMSLGARWNYYPYLPPLLVVVIVGAMLYLSRGGVFPKASLPKLRIPNRPRKRTRKSEPRTEAFLCQSKFTNSHSRQVR